MMNPYSSFGNESVSVPGLETEPEDPSLALNPRRPPRRARAINPYIHGAQMGAQEGAQATDGSMGGGLGGLFGGLLSQWIAKKYLSDKGGAE